MSPSVILPRPNAEDVIGISAKQVSRWQKHLRDVPKYRDKLILAVFRNQPGDAVSASALAPIARDLDHVDLAGNVTERDGPDGHRGYAGRSSALGSR